MPNVSFNISFKNVLTYITFILQLQLLSTQLSSRLVLQCCLPFKIISKGWLGLSRLGCYWSLIQILVSYVERNRPVYIGSHNWMCVWATGSQCWELKAVQTSFAERNRNKNMYLLNMYVLVFVLSVCLHFIDYFIVPSKNPTSLKFHIEEI